MGKTEDYSDKKLEILYGFRATGLLLFNVAHWMFAYKYFYMARQVPFKLANREVLKNIVICDKITNWVFFSLNFIPPILYGVGVIGYYEAVSNGNEKLIPKFRGLYRITYLIIEFMPIMSGVYLFTALYFLSKFARKDYQINIKAMTLHATSFALYMASALLYMYAFVMVAYLSRMKYETMLICFGITYICSSLSQAVLCIIFWKLGKKRESQNMQ